MNQLAMQRHVVRHLTACCVEAKEHHQLYDDAATPAGMGLVAMSQMFLACAWSLGSSLASNDMSEEQRQDLFRELMREAEGQFRHGLAHPGEGRMF